MQKLLFFLLCPLLCYGQQRILPGRVAPKVAITEGSTESYALFLPQEYHKDSLYTTVFIFDPEGRGETAVRKFAPAARLTQSILIAPNQPMVDSLPLALEDSERFINTMLELLPIDEERIIVAGRAKGGQLATSSGQLSGSLLGVIAVDDAFIKTNYLRNNNRTQYAFLVSDESEKYYIMQQMDFELKFVKSYLGITVYDPTEDGWPESGYLSSVLTSILLKSDIDIETATRYYEDDLGWGELLYNRSRFLNAFAFVSGLKKKYRGKIEDDDGQKALLKRIRENGRFRAQRNHRVGLREREAVLLDDFVYYLAEDIGNAYFDNLGWWNSQMADLDIKIDSTGLNPLERKAAKRLKGFVKSSAELRWKGIERNAKSKFEQRLFVNILRTLIDPKNYDAYLQTISYSTREGDTDAALFYLEELLQNGFTDMDALYRIEGTSALRITKEYNGIVKEFLGRSKYY